MDVSDKFFITCIAATALTILGILTIVEISSFNRTKLFTEKGYEQIYLPEARQVIWQKADTMYNYND